ncbi:hypothetical protein ABE28_005245 [Peribacillus muralis]|uniref:Uncharacterized protein n=1 Tax=Peribacillus muralis TaxID=264697 RepID=A0A1B3XKK8_9BACI|nr:hypothetical protein [Peribacillus muralis]AOH53746.1 hypothetical protein ABE28_005245 [Peribacillus muralis]
MAASQPKEDAACILQAASSLGSNTSDKRVDISLSWHITTNTVSKATLNDSHGQKWRSFL